MKALVTGGTGFTGSHLVRRLITRGFEVRVLDNSPGLFAQDLKGLGAHITLGSVTDAAIVDRVTAGVDRVFHLAAVFRQINLPDRIYHEVNVTGTRVVGEAALRHGIKSFVYCSTQGVHGNVSSPPGDKIRGRTRDFRAGHTWTSGNDITSNGHLRTRRPCAVPIPIPIG